MSEATMIVSMRAGDRIHVNGAIIRVDRKVRIELINNVTFLLDAYVIRAENANTPLMQLYFILQCYLMDPVRNEYMKEHIDILVSAISKFQLMEETERSLFSDILKLIKGKKIFAALKVIRSIREIKETDYLWSFSKHRKGPTNEY